MWLKEVYVVIIVPCGRWHPMQWHLRCHKLHHGFSCTHCHEHNTTYQWGWWDVCTHIKGYLQLRDGVAPLLWPSVGVKPNTWKSRESESSWTPECSELDSKAQNTSPWGVLGVIGKVSKCRCLKWPRIGHLDICSPSYGQKKGRESNWQFDSRPLKVWNRPVLDVRSGSATRRWKALFEGYKIGSDLVAIRGRSEDLWLSKVPGVQPGHVRDNFETPFREPREFVPFGCSPHGASQSIL
jgi:hypothetical protein